MQPIERKSIDWEKTGKQLLLIREDNINLRKQVCKALKHDKGDCSGACDNCKFDMDNHISRKELAKVFCVSENVIFNWENGRTAVDYENLLFYEQLCGRPVNEIVVMREKPNA